MKKLLPLFLLLGGCSWVGITNKPVDFKPLSVPDPKPLALSQTNWTVYNANDIEHLCSTFTKSSAKHFLLFGMDNSNFNNLDANIQDMTRYILEMKATKEFYQNLELKKDLVEKKK